MIDVKWSTCMLFQSLISFDWTPWVNYIFMEHYNIQLYSSSCVMLPLRWRVWIFFSLFSTDWQWTWKRNQNQVTRSKKVHFQLFGWDGSGEFVKQLDWKWACSRKDWQVKAYVWPMFGSPHLFFFWCFFSQHLRALLSFGRLRETKRA